LAERLGYKGMSGVVVSGVEPGSLAAAGGIQPGMLIQEVNRQQIKNTKDFYEALEKAGEEGTILLYINNGQYSQYLVLKLDKK
jgi:serine protease Do